MFLSCRKHNNNNNNNNNDNNNKDNNNNNGVKMFDTEYFIDGLEEREIELKMELKFFYTTM